MGYTSFTKKKVQEIVYRYFIKEVCDFGAQNDFSGPSLPAPYISEWYKSKGIKYYCIDLNGENGACQIDLGFPIPEEFYYDGLKRKEWLKIDPLPSCKITCFLVDAGTSEHVGRNGRFDWEAIYNCWANKWNLLVNGGIMYNENPLSGNWPKHGWNYYTEDFYRELDKMLGGVVLSQGLHAACNNTIDGWNIWSIIKSNGRPFISLDEFKTLPLKQS